MSFRAQVYEIFIIPASVSQQSFMITTNEMSSQFKLSEKLIDIFLRDTLKHRSAIKTQLGETDKAGWNGYHRQTDRSIFWSSL